MDDRDPLEVAAFAVADLLRDCLPHNAFRWSGASTKFRGETGLVGVPHVAGAPWIVVKIGEDGQVSYRVADTAGAGQPVSRVDAVSAVATRTTDLDGDWAEARRRQWLAEKADAAEGPVAPMSPF